jgi:hypothetical protein
MMSFKDMVDIITDANSGMDRAAVLGSRPLPSTKSMKKAG